MAGRHLDGKIGINVMNWLVVVLGAGLALIGALAIYMGLDLAQVERGIQVERGWVMVVAGATLIAGGVVTLAIGRLLFRLEALGRNFHARAAVLPDAARGNGQPETARARPRPAILAPAIAAGAVAAAGAGMVAAHASQADESPEPEADRLQDEAQDAADDAELAASVPNVGEAVALDPAGPVAPPATGPAADHGRHASIPQPEDFDDDWLDRALSGDGDGQLPEPADHVAQPKPWPEPVDHSEPAHAKPVHAEPVHADMAHAMPEPAIADETAQSTHEAALAQEPVPHEVPPPAKTIVGRYHAAGVDYVMYQDNSIDADDGVRLRQFTSMADLKAHISNPE